MTSKNQEFSDKSSDVVSIKDIEGMPESKDTVLPVRTFYCSKPKTRISKFANSGLLNSNIKQDSSLVIIDGGTSTDNVICEDFNVIVEVGKSKRFNSPNIKKSNTQGNPIGPCLQI